MQKKIWRSEGFNLKFRNLVAYDEANIVYLELDVDKPASHKDRAFNRFNHQISDATDTNEVLQVARDLKIGVASMRADEIAGIEDGELVGENHLVFHGARGKIRLRDPSRDNKRALLEFFADLARGPTVTRVNAFAALKMPLIAALIGALAVVLGFVLVAEGPNLSMQQKVTMSYQSGGRLGIFTLLAIPGGLLAVAGAVAWAIRRLVVRPTVKLYENRLTARR